MEQLNNLIEKQYHQPGLFEDIIERLKKQGVDIGNVSRNDIAPVDEFHLRGAEASKELVEEFDLKNGKVLDVGCGLGGPCRMFAEEFNCEATGVDISAEFVATAQRLSQLVNLDNKTTFVRADACNLPFNDQTFDVVWTQHVQMNIKDKAKFYYEISRVLKPGGTFIYYDIFRNGDQDVYYPVPWADDPSVSFLSTTGELHNLLGTLGMVKVKTSDQTAKAISFLDGVFHKIEVEGPPKMGLNVLLGAATKEKLTNVHRALKSEKIVVQSGSFRK